ncbi:LacI family DNA-binding transcriptional regulator [Paraglaciecola agarilytica]|uniref:LacI family DNA-binding transcriptional regulator n=1 Tax=Paraglaciecola chathamensis TaxID=368405 RepID=UPI001C080A6B|nr:MULTISPECIES: LacI family DNA-binding transcriptional regulator [Paraglaciecola]MBU3018829.1 LacI family DNA-binding transcriptional regulator [Paraglaciecola agarilytica]MDO6840193.1 LacI family DNA-binding transcriptional regulator [Paraglaciecola chathamensis]
MVTIKDVARVAGVSPSTVSRVVRGAGKVGKKCRAHVQSVIVEMGYYPNINARALVSQKAEMVGIVTPNFASPFFGSISSGVAAAAKAANYKVMMSNSSGEVDAEIEAINSLREHGCSNIILHSKLSSEETLEKLALNIDGLVIINRQVDSLAERCVWLDNVAGGRMSAEYLLKKGHTKFAVIACDRDNQDAEDRLFGIQKAISRAGLSIPTENIVIVRPSLANGYKAAEALVKSGVEFTALIAYNDVMAIGASNALQDLGYRIPQDVSIIGFDDSLLAQICRPNLTTMLYPVHDMAFHATELSIQLTTQKEAVGNRTHLFMPTLVERDSVLDMVKV